MHLRRLTHVDDALYRRLDDRLCRPAKGVDRGVLDDRVGVLRRDDQALCIADIADRELDIESVDTLEVGTIPNKRAGLLPVN